VDIHDLAHMQLIAIVIILAISVSVEVINPVILSNSSHQPIAFTRNCVCDTRCRTRSHT
jgi:hypothetical protein